MGQRVGSEIVQSRIWLTGETEQVPDFDYKFAFPISIYDAIRRDADEHSATLGDEINSIYRLINSKQDIIEAGVAGRLMTWTGVRGQIGSMEVVRAIASDPIDRSHAKIPSERAIGDMMDLKVSLKDFKDHSQNRDIHVSEDEKILWNAMTPIGSFNLHINNATMHISKEERDAWNAKADGSDLHKHTTDTDNPHNVTAHQTGTYTRREIDQLFANLRESFFTYLNIVWDSRELSASLEEYDADNWNPNYILEYGDPLPEVPDSTETYFALIPATDSKVNETADCIIYIKLPGMTWQEVGFQAMKPGDLVIQYPDTLMYVWVQGRFVRLFGNSSGGNTDGTTPSDPSDLLWKPFIDADGKLDWELSSSGEKPEAMDIRGYTPQKGIDYFDGKDGEGVPVGGLMHDLLVKSSGLDYDTEWKDFISILGDFVARGGVIPKNGVVWRNISGTPNMYEELGQNTDGFMTQKATTDAINDLIDRYEKLLESADLGALTSNLNDHLNDFMNPHRVTPAQIGAVSTASFVDHTQNFENPHMLTAAQLGLGNVDNTRDIDKIVSIPVQNELDRIWDRLRTIVNGSGGTTLPDDFTYVSDVDFVDEGDNGTKVTFTFGDDTTLTLTIPKPVVYNPVTEVKIFAAVRFDRNTNEIVITQEDGTEDRFSLYGLVQVLTGSISDTIKVEISSDDRIVATVRMNCITGDHIVENVHLRGNPTATTQEVGDKSTRLATTEFVKNQVIDNLISYEVDRPLSANMGRILNQKKADYEDIIALIQDLEGIDIIDHLESTSTVAALSANMGRHLDLTKAPRVHTSPSGSTFGMATEGLFGHARSANVDPLMDGLVSRGTDNGYYAREDHRHPTDKSRAPVHFPDEFNEIYKLTGEPRTEMPPDDSNDDRIASTEWIRRNAVGVVKGECETDGKDCNKTATLRSTFVNPVVFLRQIGSTVSITFTNEDQSGRSNTTTLNVNDTGAAPILFAGAPVTNGMIGKNHEHMFVFDGENWRLINPVPGTGIGGPDGITIGPGRTDLPEDPDMPIINRMSGHNGVTVNTGDIDENGLVRSVWIGINYTPKAGGVEVSISNSRFAWAVKMGDGTYIRCTDPILLEQTDTTAVFQFTLDKGYPANSPCQLIYRTELAWINIRGA